MQPAVASVEPDNSAAVTAARLRAAIVKTAAVVPARSSVYGAGAAHAQPSGTAVKSKSDAYATQCRRTTWDEIAGLFDRWNRSLATHNPDQVVANYSREAVLLPTVSNVPRTTPAEIRDYFEHFLEKSPAGRIDRRVIRIRCNIASDAGLYTFTLHERDGTVHQVAARYSFVYEWRNGQWLIAHHHSSAMPQPVTTAMTPVESLPTPATMAPVAKNGHATH